VPTADFSQYYNRGRLYRACTNASACSVVIPSADHRQFNIHFFNPLVWKKAMSFMTIRGSFWSGCHVVLLVLLARSVQADNGGYVDLTFKCDVTVTCPQICARSINDCPSLVKCRGGETLCNDGSCATFCDPSLTSPCQEISPCAPVTCAYIDTFYDSCRNDFGPWYEFASNCPALEPDDIAASAPEPKLSWTKWSYIFVYAWVSTVTGAIISWCWYK
jgi:hypothetical protein